MLIWHGWSPRHGVATGEEAVDGSFLIVVIGFYGFSGFGFIRGPGNSPLDRGGVVVEGINSGCGRSVFLPLVMDLRCLDDLCEHRGHVEAHAMKTCRALLFSVRVVVKLRGGEHQRGRRVGRLIRGSGGVPWP